MTSAEVANDENGDETIEARRPTVADDEIAKSSTSRHQSRFHRCPHSAVAETGRETLVQMSVRPSHTELA